MIIENSIIGYGVGSIGWLWTFALLFALTLFLVSWFVHLIIWRIHRPVSYPIWLPIIFSFVPIIFISLLVLFLWYNTSFSYLMPILLSLPLYIVLSACYMGGYAGIIEYSPSAEILKAINELMPTGMPVDNLDAETLTEEALTGKRFRHLVDSGCASQEGDKLRLTAKGARFVVFCLFYRKLLFLSGEPRG